MNSDNLQFKKNLDYLQKYQKALYEKILALLFPQPEPRLIATKTELPTIKIKVAKQDTYLYSKYDPLKTVANYFIKLEKYKFPSIFILGLGLGYTLGGFDCTSSLVRHLFIIEPLSELFVQSLYCFDYSAYLESAKCHFYIGESAEKIIHDIQQKFSLDVSYGFTVVQDKILYQENSAYYDFLQKEISNEFTIRNAGMQADFKQSRKMTENLFSNIPVFINAYKVSELRNSHSGQSAVLVGPGPSLATAIPYLLEIKKSSLLIVLDTAVSILISCGIKPDIIVSVDYTEKNKRHFEEILSEEILPLLVIDPCAASEVITKYQVPIATYNPGLPLLNWFEEKVGSFGELKRGLNVAHLGIGVAILLGVSPIYLTGIDFSYSKTAAYTAGSKKKETQIVESAGKVYKLIQSANSQKLTPLAAVPANMGTEVYVDREMQLYKLLFERILAENPGVYINTSKVGVKINYTQQKSWSDIVVSGVKQGLNLKIKAHQTEQKKKVISVNTGVQEVLTELENLVVKCKEGLATLDILKQVLQDKDQVQQQLNMQNINQLKKYIITSSLFSLLEQQMPEETYLMNKQFFLKQVFTIDDKLKHFSLFFSGSLKAVLFLEKEFIGLKKKLVL